MKRLKRLTTLFLAFALILILPSCAPKEDSSDKLSVVTTIFPQYDFARAVAAEVPDKVELTMLLPPGSESHDYEPSLADLALIEGCDLFICVGGETDAWVESAIEAVGGNVNVLRLIDCVPLLPEASDGIIENSREQGHSEDEEHGHNEHVTYDEHVWTSPENAAVLTQTICDAMCRLEPSLADSFRRSADGYTAVLNDLSDRFSALAENAVRRTVFFVDRFPFRYLMDYMDLDFRASFAGCSSDSEPALSTIYRMTEELKASDAKVIFTAEFSTCTAADVIADECAVEVATLHSCHNVSRSDFESGVTYAELMEQNLVSLTKALT